MRPVTRISDRKQHALGLFSGLPARYGSMGAVLSFGQDLCWRQSDAMLARQQLDACSRARDRNQAKRFGPPGHVRLPR